VFGIIIGSPALRPIEWAAWAGEAEKDTRRPKGKKRLAYLEDRKGFYDIRVSSMASSVQNRDTDLVCHRQREKSLRIG
jgi:hypothetical protein